MSSDRPLTQDSKKLLPGHTGSDLGPTLGKVPLRLVLIVPFLLQILATVGLVGYLSFRNGQQAVNELATRLQREVGDRVDQQLDVYFGTARQVNKINQGAIDLGLINPQDLSNTGRYFWRQMQVYPGLSHINLTNQAGQFVGIGRDKNDGFYLELETSAERGLSTAYALDQQGNRARVVQLENASASERRRYERAIALKKPIWTDIYASGDQPGEFSISCAIPILNKLKQPIGVVGVDLFLPQIEEFLQKLKPSRSGNVFIIEPNGTLVASSNPGASQATVAGKPQRLNALDSPEISIKATAQQLSDRFSDLGTIKEPQQFNFDLKGQRQFVQVIPWQDPWGLNLFIIVAIPESDFMGQINSNTRITVLLCLVTLLISVALGVLITRWISKPILRLTEASQAIANSELDHRLDVQGISELATLAESFNRMTYQLRDSFTALEIRNADLQETQIALAEAKEQLEAVLNAVPGSISWIDSGGVYVGVNRYFAESWNLSQEAFIGKEVGFLQGSTQLAEFTRQFLNSSQQSASQIIELHINESIRYFLVAAQKYQRNSATVSVGIDITDRRQAEESLRIAEENYRSIFENALEGIFQAGPDGRFINVNPAMARIHGYDTPEDMIASVTKIDTQIYVDSTVRETAKQLLEEQGSVKNLEYQAYCKDGSIIWVEEDTRVVRDRQGQLLYYEGIIRDITQRKQQEENLKRQLQELQIEIDQQKRKQEVATITQSDYFQSLQAEAERLQNDEFWSN